MNRFWFFVAVVDIGWVIWTILAVLLLVSVVMSEGF